MCCNEDGMPNVCVCVCVCTGGIAIFTRSPGLARMPVCVCTLYIFGCDGATALISVQSSMSDRVLHQPHSAATVLLEGAIGTKKGCWTGETGGRSKEEKRGQALEDIAAAKCSCMIAL